MKTGFAIALAACCVLSGQAEAIRVACIGDSITYGYAMTNRVAECYPAKLAALLGDGYEVRNFGDPGAGVYTHLKAFDGKGPRAWRLRAEYAKALAFKPQIVVSNLGINDAGEYAKELLPDLKTGKTALASGTFRREYVDLLETFAVGGTRPRFIIWTRLGPCMKRHSLKGSVLPFVMERDLADVAARVGAETLDMYGPLFPYAETADFCADGIHPEGGACAVIARVTARKILRADEGPRAVLDLRPDSGPDALRITSVPKAWLP